MNFTRNEHIRPIVLIDIDGVCVKWQSGLPYYMAKHNIPTNNALKTMISEEFLSAEELFGMDEEVAFTFLKDYNKSKFIKYLSPYDDALVMINEMKEYWDFVAVTALGTDKETVMNRAFNLNALFPGAFKDILVCGAGEPKDNILMKAKDKHNNIVMFIDDLGINIDSAERVLPNVPRYHVCRGPRAKAKSDCFEVTNLNEVRLHYLSKIRPQMFTA
ncbi:DNA ligase [Acinetobacter phage AB1I1M-1]